MRSFSPRRIFYRRRSRSRWLAAAAGLPTFNFVPFTAELSRSMTDTTDRTLFRKTLVRVLTMQAAALLALWLLQSVYSK